MLTASRAARETGSRTSVMVVTLPAVWWVRQAAGQQTATDCQWLDGSITMKAMPTEPAALSPHPDRLLPTDPGVRTIARRLYDAVRDLPIISPHGHVDPRWLVDDEPFADPTSLLLQPDHYVTRLLHASGVPLDALGVGAGPLPEPQARAAWRLLCGNGDVFRGTPVRYGFDSQLSEIFGVTQRPSAANAD